MLEIGIYNGVQQVAVQEGNQGSVISDEVEVLEANQENLHFDKTCTTPTELQLNGGIECLSVHQETHTGQGGTCLCRGPAGGLNLHHRGAMHPSLEQ